MKKDLKKLIASGMTLPQAALGIAQALEDMGGTAEDFTSIISDRLQCDEIAKLILRRHILYVDRGTPPVYPDLMKSLLYQELEDTGLVEYDMRKLNLFLLINQNMQDGMFLHEYLRESKMIENCLGLRDFEEIQKKGCAFFQRYFDGKMILGWKSVLVDEEGSYVVPVLYEPFGAKLVQGWIWLRKAEYLPLHCVTPLFTS